MSANLVQFTNEELAVVHDLIAKTKVSSLNTDFQAKNIYKAFNKLKAATKSMEASRVK